MTAPLILLWLWHLLRQVAAAPASAYLNPRTPRQKQPGDPALDWNESGPSLTWDAAVRLPDAAGGRGPQPKFRVGLHPQGAPPPSRGVPCRPGPCLSLVCLDEGGHGRQYHDATFRLRWKFTSGGDEDDSKSDGFEGIEWSGGKRFGGAPAGEDAFVCAFPAREAEELGALFRDGRIEEALGSVDLEAEVVLHGSGPAGRNAENAADEARGDGGPTPDPRWWRSWRGYRAQEYAEEESWLETGLTAAQFGDVRAASVPSSGGEDAHPSREGLRVGSVVIPLLSTRAEGILPEPVERPLRILFLTLFSATVLGGSWVNVPSNLLNNHRSMWEKGCYPGVEYRVTRITGEDGQECFYHRDGADYELSPIYPLGPILDRRWPARINEAEIPNLISPLQYNIATAVGALAASASILSSFFVASLVVSLFFIPSRSMEPTLNVGDVLLVEKVTPRLPFNSYRRGDVVMFRPPGALRDLVERNGGRLSGRDLFVKRVAAVAGDVVEVKSDGEVAVTNMFEETGAPRRRNLCKAEPLGLIKKYVKPGVTLVPPGRVMVLGDCGSVSVDGRVWGTLDVGDIVGRPLVRTWPPSKMSGIPSLPTVGNQWSD